ncbi:hypothetical protein EJB05_24217, partial [Eragrostis curvula]
MEAGMERAKPKPTEEAALAAAVSSVLGDDDLLREILLLLGFPTTLVRAALVCRRWLRVASHPDFLRRFRDLHPPRLLGFYLTSNNTFWMRRPVDFVPMAPQPPELAVVLQRGSFSLDIYEGPTMVIRDCLNGNVFFTIYHPAGNSFTHGVHTPLHPTRGLVTVPDITTKYDRNRKCLGNLLFRESGDGLSCFWFLFIYKVEGAELCLYMLQDGVWRMLDSATTDLHNAPPRARYNLLVEDRIYIAVAMTSILVWDLASSTLSTIMLPDGVHNKGNILLSRADGSGVYLVHLKELQLCIWLLSGSNGSIGDWFLVDTICLRDMCSNLRISNSTTGNNGTSCVLLNAVGDNAEFVFLNNHRSVFYLDVKSRAVHKVYEMTEADQLGCQIIPCMMTWPPTFPSLK